MDWWIDGLMDWWIDGWIDWLIIVDLKVAVDGEGGHTENHIKMNGGKGVATNGKDKQSIQQGRPFSLVS